MGKSSFHSSDDVHRKNKVPAVGDWNWPPPDGIDDDEFPGKQRAVPD